VVYRATDKTRARQRAARERLLQAARQLVSEGGFAALQVSALAERAGMATGTVYRHVDSKAALAVEVFSAVSQGEVDAMGRALHDEGLRSALRTWCARAQARPVLARALLSEPVGPEVEAARLRFRSAYAELLAAHLARCIAEGSLPPQDARLSAAAVVGALGEAVLGPHGPADADAIVTFCLQALGAQPCPPPTT
jgi:AcrR family transcriptional regulator